MGEVPKVIPMSRVGFIKDTDNDPIPKGISPMFDKWIDRVGSGLSLDEVRKLRGSKEARRYARQLGIVKD